MLLSNDTSSLKESIKSKDIEIGKFKLDLENTIRQNTTNLKVINNLKQQVAFKDERLSQMTTNLNSLKSQYEKQNT